MPSGFFALLDDVAGIARLAAASLDDVAGTAGRVGLKAAGVVVDDTAVTPRYVAGLAPERELPIIGRIGLGSLRNKLLFLLPAALLLNAVAPWAVTPLLMLGGVYLCFEGVEKVVEVVEVVLGHGGHEAVEAAGADPKLPSPSGGGSAEGGSALEDRKVKGAIRTDLILSAEIMAISLAEVADRPVLVEAVVLALVGTAITVGVYGVVALVVKADDIGLHLARRGAAPVRAIGRGLVRSMPPVMTALSAVGTAAMIWVGGGILLHGLEAFGVPAPAHALDDAAEAAAERMPAGLAGAAEWLVGAAGAGMVGLAVGGLAVAATLGARRLRG